MLELNKFPIDEGVYLLTVVNNNFEDLYIQLRKKEQRVYSDDDVMKLPFAGDSNPHKKEWNLRTKSFLRFKEYLGKKNENLNILDLGCGNCWLCGQLSKTLNHSYYCVDVNLTELKQGKRIFKSDNLKFLYADIFTSDFPKSYFDIIILNSAVQYFSDLKKLIERLLVFLNDTGEIHIIDSPIYKVNEVSSAQQRTEQYFSSIDFLEMAKNYFHHNWIELVDFPYKILYYPNSLKNKMLRLLSFKDSPFPWICIMREEKAA